ncbi:MAG: beta-glucosidase [Proteobacteria bacterium]|nr:beta-glucosidase [Pseudomonadota bacterium]
MVSPPPVEKLQAAEAPLVAKVLGPDFVWGVSTSAYQIEGAAGADGRGASVWDGFCRVAGRIANGDTGDEACDHYHRYAEDVALMQQIGVSAYRFSIAWPRVMPLGRGAANEAGLAFYDRLVDRLLAADIEPWICLYHWDLPQALQDAGGWVNRDVVSWFADYARLVADRLGDRVKRFATFNEPSVFTLFGYSFGWHPPAIDDPRSLYAAVHHVNLAHGAAVDVLRARVAKASIGAIHNMQPSRPVRPTAPDRAAAAMLDDFWNRAFPDPQILGDYPASIQRGIEPHRQAGDMERIRRPVDWLGINHYSPIYAKADPAAPLGFAWADAPPDVPRSPIGWQVDPAAFRDTLLDAHERYALPIYVLENGAGAVEKPDAAGEIDDRERIDYLAQYTGALRDAVVLGADVRGYFVWSLLDNFEWGAGYANRFGLVYVDYPTQRRIPKASARWYAALIRSEAMKVAS